MSQLEHPDHVHIKMPHGLLQHSSCGCTQAMMTCNCKFAKGQPIRFTRRAAENFITYNNVLGQPTFKDAVLVPA